MSNITIIGSGFAGLSAASFMAKAGHSVTIHEKNDLIGGRARCYSAKGFMFDMGPSWYWMPDVFEKYFASFGKKPSDYYDLVQLDPGFQMIFGKDDVLEIPAHIKDIHSLFESIEKGSSEKLSQFLAQAKIKYDIGMGTMVYKPSLSWMEFANWEVVSNAPKLQMFQSVASHVRIYFKDPRLVAMMEFPVLFLGAMANQIPALYSMMNYAALAGGTWYPMGGMTKIIEGMRLLAEELGVKIMTDSAVQNIAVNGEYAHSIETISGFYKTDAIIATGDYHHIEQQLLPEKYRNYNESYWDKKTFAPSSLIFYLGINKKIKKLIHHNLFFDTELDKHAQEIYKNPQWPSAPLFYVCCPSKTDSHVAPEGMENIFILMPIAPGLKDTEELREQYYDIIINRLENLCEDSIKENVVYKRSYCINDFIKDYNAYKGNAYGLANTLNQTAVLKPTLRNKKIRNLYYAGQLTTPGPGVPPSLISGEVAASQLLKHLKPTKHEATV